MTSPESRAVVRRLNRLSQIEPGRDSTERALERAHALLTSLLAATAAQAPQPARPWGPILRRPWRWTGSQGTMALGGALTALALTFLLVSPERIPSSASAMERMAENVRQAKSYRCLEIAQGTQQHPQPGEPAVTETRHNRYWLAPGSSRDEMWHSDTDWKGLEPEIVEICPVGKPTIQIDHHHKEFHRYPPLRVGPFSSAFDDLQRLDRFAGKAARELGTKPIDGKLARGFTLDMKDMESDYTWPGRAEIWLDCQSFLPVLVRYEEMTAMGWSYVTVAKDIQWNVELPPELFDATPPAGYVDATPKPPSLEQQVRQISEALKTYAEASGGHYPQVTVLDGINTGADVCRMLGLTDWPGGATEGNAGKAAQAIDGFERMGELFGRNPDPAYYGKTVGPKDKNKVLFRWQLDDGRYEVIFGDLSAETVTAERLRTLEGKSR